MQKPSRSPEAVQAQIDAFKATLPKGLSGPPEGDFAARLEWDSWQQHLDELGSELVLAQQQGMNAATVSKETEQGAVNVALRITDPFIINMLENQARDSGIGVEDFARIVLYDALEHLWVDNNKAKPAPAQKLLPQLASL